MLNTIEVNLNFFNIILEKIDKIIDKKKYNFSFNVNYNNDLILSIYLKDKIQSPSFIIKLYNLKTSLNFDVYKNDIQLNKVFLFLLEVKYKENDINKIDDNSLNKVLKRLKQILINK